MVGAAWSGQNENEEVVSPITAPQEASNIVEDYRWVFSSKACSW